MRVAYICDGGGTFGWGHVWRGRALVAEAPSGSALVMGSGREEVTTWFRSHGMEFAVEPWEAPDRPLNLRGCRFDVLVVDHYDVSPEWIADASVARPTYVVDDWMRERFAATGLVNPNVGATRDDYPGVHAERWLLGAAYALVRGEVRRLPRGTAVHADARRVLITMGGSDPGSCTADVVDAVAGLDWFQRGGSVTVVLGASYRGRQGWTDWSSEQRQRLEVVRQPPDFLERCLAADVVVCGASTISNELAFLGRPFVPVAFVENQAVIVERWARYGVGNGVKTWEAGWGRRLAEQVATLLHSVEVRKEAAGRGMALIDGGGIERLLAAWRGEVRG